MNKTKVGEKCKIVKLKYVSKKSTENGIERKKMEKKENVKTLRNRR